MKKKFFIILSLVLAALFIFTACKAPKNGVEMETEEEAATDVKATDAVLFVNGIDIAEYTVVYDGRVSVGSETAMKHFNSKLKQQYKIELQAKTSASDGYRIFIGVKGSDSSISEFYDSCEEGMIGSDGENIYLLAKNNGGLYNVVDAFFAKATSDGACAEITVSENQKIAYTKESLTVMSYNVLYDVEGRDVTALAAFIKEQNADVFGTQETKRVHKDAILEAMPNYNCYEGVVIKGGAEMQNMIFWNADKYKAVSKGFQYLTDTPFVASKIDESNSYRGFSYVVLESLATKKQFLFVNVHLTYRDSDGNAGGDKVKLARLKQAQYLISFLEDKKYETMPIVLVGDFNSVPGSDALNAVDDSKRIDRTAIIANTKGDLGGTTTRNVRSIRDTYVFDHIFVTADRISTEYFTAVNYKENGKFPSDHLPVTAEIVIY